MQNTISYHRIKQVFTAFVACILFTQVNAQQTKRISKEQLEYYLSKSVDILQLNDYCKTASGFYPGTNIRIVEPAELNNPQQPGTVDDIRQQDILSGNMFSRYNDVLRLIRNVKPKFIANAVSQWGTWDWEAHINRCTQTVRDIKAIDNDIIVQASVNEFVDAITINSIGNIPQWVYDEFGISNQNRKFNLNNMMFADWQTNSPHWWGYMGLNSSGFLMQ